MSHSIKPDSWIRRMALESGMIDPFVERQVREGVVSFGLSSYGYDIRVADEYRIFSAATGRLSVVDPKQIDERAMVPYQGESCIIPPNSFALARTVEYFRIPRNVLTICLGKSTYARCFRGDTRVALVDGTSASLEEMARRAEAGELFWGYSIGRFGRILVTLLEAPRLIGRDVLVEVAIDNGETIACTPDHEFVTRDGRLLPAEELRPGDALMPLYRKAVRGKETLFQPSTRHLVPTRLLADEWNLRHGLTAHAPRAHGRDNRPGTIERMEASAHIRLHSAESYGGDFGADEQSAPVKSGLDSRQQDPMWVAALSAVNRRKAHAFWNKPEYQAARHPLPEAQLASLTEESRNAQRAAGLRHCQEPAHRAEAGRVQRLARQPDNHKVTSIRSLPGMHDVYCLTVPEVGNFALEAGVFVRNCGIIVNVTPFEPEWEGHVTIEISNTTPLPAKIYSNEGIAQVLFFEGEPPEVSYADRQGKYQAQRGITLPKL